MKKGQVKKVTLELDYCPGPIPPPDFDEELAWN